jgi:hypothetical protein
MRYGNGIFKVVPAARGYPENDKDTGPPPVVFLPDARGMTKSIQKSRGKDNLNGNLMGTSNLFCSGLL